MARGAAAGPWTGPSDGDHPWPHVRDTLQNALRQALSRPGAEGLAARDGPLDVIRRFHDARATATAADDPDQRRAQDEIE
ncbi:hypothetical protein ACWC09_14840 [Streptomyces sp. NPDC001617]